MSNFTLRFFSAAAFALVVSFVACKVSAGTNHALAANPALRVAVLAKVSPDAKRALVYNQGLVGKPRKGNLNWDARHGSSEAMPLDTRTDVQPGE